MRHLLALLVLLAPAVATAAPAFVTTIAVSVDGKPATFEVHAKPDACWRKPARAKANVSIDRGKLTKVEIVETTDPRSAACLKRALLAAKAGTATANATIELASIDADTLLTEIRTSDKSMIRHRAASTDPDPNGLTASAIDGVIKAAATDIRACYQKALGRAAPDLRGKVTVHFEIAPDGAVKAARVTSSTLRHPGVESCVIGQVKRLTFPSSPTKSTVSYPFLFEQA
jgi:outer membrane biosynthesis protein TonB